MGRSASGGGRFGVMWGLPVGLGKGYPIAHGAVLVSPQEVSMSPESVANLFRVATENHQAGRLKQAEAGYRSVIALQADQPFCLQQLGLCLAQLGRPKEAVPFLEK